MTVMNRRNVLKGSVGAALLAAFDTALLGDANAQEQPKRGGTLAYAQLSANRRSAAPENAKHPYFIVDANTRIQWNCLTWVNPKLELELELASKIEPTDDKLNVWDVTCREGVMFHNGREMTAEDVVSSFDYHRQNAPFARQITKIEAMSKYVARFFLDAGNAEFGYILAEYNSVIMPKGDLKTIGMDGIGTGPFRIVSADPNRNAIMERFDGYWRKGFPYLDRLEIHNREGQQESALNGLRSGQFDAVLNIDARAAAQLGSDPAFDIESAKGGYSFVIQLPKHPGSPFLDKRVRQAFAFAIDREAIVRIAYGGKFGWVSNDSHLMVTDPTFVPKPGGRDIAKAKALLAEAGHPNGINLGTLYWSPQLPEAGRYFQVLQQSVKDAGITIALEERPNDGYIQFRQGDEDFSKGKFHKFAMTAVGSRNPGISLFRMRANNLESGHWRGAEHDKYLALYNQAMVTADATKRKAIYAEMQAILHEEVPAILPAGGDTFLVKRKTVRNMPYHPQIWSILFDQVWKA
ncbi:DdpA ABC-type dipeptide transport system, periplasmic component [Rhabdaerophilaceae bacterium]